MHRNNTHRRTIWVKLSLFSPEFKIIIPVPYDRDDEEYIDELMDGMLNDKYKQSFEWDFADGIS